MTENIIQEKSYTFALGIVKCVKDLQDNKKEFTFSKQLAKSGTSIWANVEEAIWWISHADFLAKIFIAYKEARETHYWLRLLRDSQYLIETYLYMIDDCEEILKILWAIIKTWKANKTS